MIGVIFLNLQQGKEDMTCTYRRLGLFFLRSQHRSTLPTTKTSPNLSLTCLPQITMSRTYPHLECASGRASIRLQRDLQGLSLHSHVVQELEHSIIPDERHLFLELLADGFVQGLLRGFELVTLVKFSLRLREPIRGILGTGGTRTADVSGILLFHAWRPS